MAEAEAPLPPIEIPWKLAATTQPLSAGEPAETALSLFFFEPDDTTLTSLFPDDRLVFVKFTASISPAAFPSELSKVAASFLGEGIPCMHLLLDLKVRNAAGDLGTIRPYFHAAAPLARRMVQTGVVGVDSYEGEAEGLAIGKSGAQMNETLRSHSNTNSSSASAGLTTSCRYGAAHLDSARFGPQHVHRRRERPRGVAVIDTTNRAGIGGAARTDQPHHAGREHHLPAIAKYLGTPHLSFSVSPQPLQQLSIDPSDPNLWFQQLLAGARAASKAFRSSPRCSWSRRPPTSASTRGCGESACSIARRDRSASTNASTARCSQFARMVDYLNKTFPIGTPLEELDIDIIGGLTGMAPFAGQLWSCGGSGCSRAWLSRLSFRPAQQPAFRHAAGRTTSTSSRSGSTRCATNTSASRPARRWSAACLFGENRFLDTCFGTARRRSHCRSPSSTASVSPLFRLPLTPGRFDIGGAKTLSSGQVRIYAEPRAGDRHALERDRAPGHDAAFQQPPTCRRWPLFA